MYVLDVYMCFASMYVRVLHECLVTEQQDEGVRTTGTRDEGGCEPLSGC